MFRRWHLLLLDLFVDSENAPLLDRVIRHAAFGGPELFYLQSRLAHRRCNLEEACGLGHDALQALLGHAAVLRPEIGAELPPNARQVAQRRRPPLA